MTKKQIAKLKYFGVPYSNDGLTKGRASQLIDCFVKMDPEREREYQNRPATAEQRRKLRKLGHTDEGQLTYSEARDAIDELEVCRTIDEQEQYWNEGFPIDLLENDVNNEDWREDLGYKKFSQKQVKELAQHLKAHPELKDASREQIVKIALQLFPENWKAGNEWKQHAGKGSSLLSKIVSWTLFLSICAFLYSRCSSTHVPPADNKPLAATPRAEDRPTVAAPNTQAKSPATPVPSPANPAAVAEAQRLAVKRYPALGVANSPFNLAFIARYKRFQIERPEFFSDPEWPMKLAKECADVLHVK